MTTLERQERAAKRLAAAAAPTGRRLMSRGPGLGDGPVCPGDPKHGNTYLTRDRRAIFCIHQSHDMTSEHRWPNDPEPVR